MKTEPNYLDTGIGPEHIQDLIRMATDEGLNNANSETLEVWAPLHAWRALGQLRAESAVEPLLALFKRIDENDDDWVMDDLPRALGAIGPAALPTLSAYLADSAHRLAPRQAAAEGIKQIGEQHPESRDDAVAALSHELGKSTENEEALNGTLVSLLLDLEAVEAAPVMEKAFAAGAVDEAAAGDWEDVQIELGLKEKRDTPGKYLTIPGLRKMSKADRERALLPLSAIPDLQAINKARKRARSEAKKAKWKQMLQRQKRK